MLTDKQIEELLAPHMDIMRKWYDDALSKLDLAKDVMEVEVYKRLSAMVINNYVIEKAKVYFENVSSVSGITVDDKYKSLIIYFQKDGVTVRFKKLNKDSLLSSNIRTDRNTIMIQTSLFGDFPPVVRIEVGYMFNLTGTAYDRVMVVKRIDKNTAIPIIELTPKEIYTPTIVAQPVEVDLSQEDQLRFKQQIK